MNARIPALTLWRPWPTLILSYGKDVENRPWTTRYRGLLLIHAGKHYDYGAWIFANLGGVLPDPIREEIRSKSIAAPLGIVGVAELVDVCRCITLECSPWAQFDQYHWHLSQPQPFAEPIGCPGRQGLWYPVGEAAQQVTEQLEMLKTSPQAIGVPR